MGLCVHCFQSENLIDIDKFVLGGYDYIFE